jgi:hypothetical protein
MSAVGQSADGFDQERIAGIYKLRHYLFDLHEQGLPLNFSATGVQNLSGRFSVAVEEVEKQIEYVIAEAARQQTLTESTAANWLLGTVDCDRIFGREGLERRLRLAGCPWPERVVDFALQAGWIEAYNGQLEYSVSCFSWLPTGVVPSPRHSPLDAEFSVFPGPIKYRGQPPTPTTSTLRKVFEKITTSERLRELTVKLRALSDRKEQAAFKATKLPFATFSGVFSARTDSSLIKHSGLLVIDLDGLGGDLSRIRDGLRFDPYVVGFFLSPRADGLKVLFQIDLGRHSQAQWYQGLGGYLQEHHGVPATAIDPTGSNASRACFLSYDPDAYLNKKLQ